MYKYLILILLLSGCNLLKKVDKKQNDSDLTETIVTKTTRIGDTVVYSIPTVRFKDTTIYTYNRQGTTLKVRYDTEGKVDLAECIASAVAEMKEENRRFIESQSEKQKEGSMETNINWNIVLLGGIGLVLIFAYKKF